MHTLAKLMYTLTKLMYTLSEFNTLTVTYIQYDNDNLQNHNISMYITYIFM